MKKYTNESGEIITAGTPIVVTVTEGDREVQYKMYSPSHEQYLKHGWSEYVAPTPPPPTEEEIALAERERIDNLRISQKELGEYLESMGLPFYEQILPAIEAQPQTKVAFWGATYIQRNDPTISSFAQAFGVTDEQIDTMFISINDKNAGV